jgi:hypothetical protein
LEIQERTPSSLKSLCYPAPLVHPERVIHYLYLFCFLPHREV